MQEKIGAKYWVAWGAVALLPLAIIVEGIVLLCKGMMPNIGNVIHYFLFPVTILVSSCALIWCRLKVWMNLLIYAGMLFGLLVATFFLGLLVPFESLAQYTGEKAVTRYPEAFRFVECMPEPDEIGQPEKTEFFIYNEENMLFGWQSDTLICEYGEEEYAEQKRLVEATYEFQQSPIIVDEYICEPSAELDGYVFRLLSYEEYDYLWYYPNYMALIATNDHTHEIVYMYFEDIDLDYIDTSLADFIYDECGWKYIR